MTAKVQQLERKLGKPKDEEAARGEEQERGTGWRNKEREREGRKGERWKGERGRSMGGG